MDTPGGSTTGGIGGLGYGSGTGQIRGEQNSVMYALLQTGWMPPSTHAQTHPLRDAYG